VSGVPVYKIQQLERLDFSNWNVVEYATRVANSLAIPLSDILPDELIGEKLLTDISETRELSGAEILTTFAGKRLPQPEDEIYSQEESREMLSRLGSLGERHRLVISEKFGINGAPLTYDEIGRKHSISRARAREVFMQGMRKLTQAIDRDKKGTT